MKKVIQAISMPNCTFYIIEFDEEKSTLKFRTSEEPNYLQEEKIVMGKDFTVHVNLYHFHISYLQKFIKENK